MYLRDMSARGTRLQKRNEKRGQEEQGLAALATTTKPSIPDSSLNKRARHVVSHALLAQSQEAMQLTLCLDKDKTPNKQITLLPGHLPYPQLLAHWRQHQTDITQYGVRLVGDAGKPDDWVAIAPDYLASHSHWAAVRASTNLQTSGVATVLPLRTPPEVVRKIVEALYSGFLDLSNDVEQVLLTADVLQMDLVKTACVTYVQQLHLRPQQLYKLARLWDRLHRDEACLEVLQKLVRKPWQASVLHVLQQMVRWLLDTEAGFQTCKMLLKDPERGAHCEAQVLIFLLSCGLSLQECKVAQLVDISRMHDTTFQLVQHLICPNSASGASYELIAGIAARNTSSMIWSPFRTVPKEKLNLTQVSWSCRPYAMTWDAFDSVKATLYHPAFQGFNPGDGTTEIRDDKPDLHYLELKRTDDNGIRETLTSSTEVSIFLIAQQDPLIQLQYTWRPRDHGTLGWIAMLLYKPDSRLSKTLYTLKRDTKCWFGLRIC